MTKEREMSQGRALPAQGIGGNADSQPIYRATLARVTSNGVGYLTDAVSNRVFVFTFDKIPHYKGEAASELGLKEGAQVKYQLDDRGSVRWVFSSAHRSRTKTRRFSFA